MCEGGHRASSTRVSGGVEHHSGRGRATGGWVCVCEGGHTTSSTRASGGVEHHSGRGRATGGWVYVREGGHTVRGELGINVEHFSHGIFKTE